MALVSARYSFVRSLLIMLLASLLPGLVLAQERSYSLATATTGGTYYPVGVAIADLVEAKLQPEHGIALMAISSAGSGENIKLLRENQAQFAILEGLYGAWAWNGKGQMAAEGPQKHLRAITMLWQDVEQFTIDAGYMKTGTIEDLHNLEGQPFSIGPQGSGTEGSGRHILNNLGIDPETTFNVVYLDYAAGAEALRNGTIEGMSVSAGVPVPALDRAFAALENNIAILGFTDDQMQEANGRYKIWTRYIIPADTYPDQTTPVETIAQPNFLAVHQNISEETVYLITKTLYENLAFLNDIHSATEAMAIDKALTGLPIPLHPGAARYYREMGITIPDDLVAE